jgi:ribonuclease P protein component
VYVGIALVAFAVRQDSTQPGVRLGVTSSRRVKGAVARNQARRRLREAARAVLLADDSRLRRPGIRYEVVLNARPAALEVDFEALKAEASGVLQAVAEL